MGDFRVWSDSELREYVRRADTGERWSDTDEQRADTSARFRASVRVRCAPATAQHVRERVGALVEADGVAIVADDLVCWGRSVDHERRWLLVSPRPWDYLAEWTAAEIIRSFRRARRIDRSSRTELEQLESQFHATE